MKVKDIMSTPPITVQVEQTVGQAAAQILEHRINAVPVLEGERVVGLLSEGDLVRLLLPRYSEVVEDEYRFQDFEAAEERADIIRHQPVRHAMTVGVLSVTPQTPVLKAAALLRAHHLKWLPVVSEGKLVGIVTRHDICKALLGKRQKA